MEPENKPQSKTVQTYAEDMAKVIESNEAGIIKRIIYEEEQEEMEKKNLSPESRRNRFFIIAGILLIMLSVGILAYLVISKEEIGTVPVEVQVAPLIFIDETTYVEVDTLSKEKIAGSILGELNSSEITAGEVEGVYLTENKQIVGFPRFLELIGSNLAKGKAGIFNDKFLLGFTNNRNIKDLFILLNIRSFTDVFNEMRIWEAKMFFDLHDFFGLELNAANNYLLTKNFEDGIIQNKNARILYDDAEEIVFMYVFIDDASVVITDTEGATREIILRLAGSRVKK